MLVICYYNELYANMKSDKIRFLKKTGFRSQIETDWQIRFLSFIQATEVLESFISGHDTNNIEQNKLHGLEVATSCREWSLHINYLTHYL